MLISWTCSHRRFLPPPHRRSDLLSLPSHPLHHLRPHLLRRSYGPNARTRSPINSNPPLPSRLSQLRHPQPFKLRFRVRNKTNQHQSSRDPGCRQADGPIARGDPGPANPDWLDVQLPQRLLPGRVRRIVGVVRADAARSGTVGAEDDRDAACRHGEAGRSR